MKQALIASLILLFAAHNAAAITFVCTSKIDAVYVEQGGNVVVHGTAAGSQPYTGWQLLCNLKRPDSVGPITCSNWLLIAAQALGEQPTALVLQTTYESVGCLALPSIFPFPMSVMISR